MCIAASSAPTVLPGVWIQTCTCILPETSGPATRPRCGLAPRRPGSWDRLFLCEHERQRLAPSNRPGLLARPMRVQIVLGRACILRGSRTAGGPVPLRGAGLRGRRDRRWPGAVARGDIYVHVVLSTKCPPAKNFVDGFGKCPGGADVPGTYCLHPFLKIACKKGTQRGHGLEKLKIK
jgi:hypothetical protein